MFDPQYQLVSTLLADLVDAAAKAAADPAAVAALDGRWRDAATALAPARESEAELAACVDARDLVALAARVAAWKDGSQLLPEPDRQLLRRAIKAFKKTLKLTRLDAESGIGGGAMSSGKRSSIVAIAPPPRFGAEVWAELVRRGRLKSERRGLYELPPDAKDDDF